MPLADLAGRLRRWMPKGAPGLTVLYVDGRWLKLLHAQGSWMTRTITMLLAHPIEGMNDEEILAWLRQACGPLHPGTVLIANPSHLTTTRLFTLPSTDSKEIRDIVELQAEKHTPYAKEEILTDFQVIETDRAGYSRVLLVLSHQDIVHRGLKLVDGMGWPLERAGFELEGLVNWFQAAQGRGSRGVVLVAEVDSDTTSLVILNDGKPYFHRSLTVGVAQLTQEADDGITKLIAEFQRSLETFEAEGFNLTVERAILTGQADRLPELAQRVQSSLGIPTSVVPQFECGPVAEGVLKDQEALARVSFAGLMGLALRPSAIDLTPKALRLHRAFEVRARRLVGLGCQVVGILLLVSCLVIGKAIKHERDRAWLAREYHQTAAQAEPLQAILEQLEFVQDWFQGRGRLLDAVAELSRRTPSAIQWDSLTFTKADGQLLLKGVSEEIPKVYDFTRELKQSPLFANVEVKRAAKHKVNDRDVTEFEIVCSLASGEPTHAQTADTRS